VHEYLLQRSQVVDSSEDGSGEDAGTESEYNDNDNDSIALTRRPRKIVVKDTMKDARELFSWKGDQKKLAMLIYQSASGLIQDTWLQALRPEDRVYISSSSSS
jgi:hypothetical protein